MIGMALIAILMCVNFTSCSKDDDDLSDSGSTITNNTIHYKTEDRIIIQLGNEYVFGDAKIISNTYSTIKSYGTIVFDSEVTAIDAFAFSGCKNLKSITIPNSVTSIGDYAFDNCESLKSITIPNSVTSIGNWAFSSCKSLTNITIPNKVTSIGEFAFSWCQSLTSITIPNSVTSIGKYAFYNCESLTSIYVNWSIPIEISSLGTIIRNVTLYVPKGLLTTYKSVNGWRDFKEIKEF